jgi:uncharacterized protein
MKSKGHEVMVTASDKDVSFDLLKKDHMEYVNVGSYGKGLLNKAINLPLIDYKMLRSVKKFSPDIFIGFGSIRCAHASFLLRKKSISFTDTEHETEQILLYKYFTDIICTPSCYMSDLGAKQIRFNSYKELAYLHPDYFKPDPSVLDRLNLGKDEKFIILRLVSWDASHDIGHHGVKDKIGMVRELERYGRVLISSEAPLPGELEKYKISLPSNKLHDLLYHASLYLGEGATMATEAALLGVPSIFISSLAGKLGYLEELEQKYGLVYSFSDQRSALDKAFFLLRDNNLKNEWAQKRNRLLEEKIDMNRFMTWLVENYPESVDTMKRDPGYQDRFKKKVNP